MAQEDQDRQTRVSDYLDDKLQTLADLESLDALLLSVRNQQSLLQRQLRDAEKDLHEAREASADHEAHIAQQKTKFQKHQTDTDRRLRIITLSETSDDAVVQFETSMEKLRRLDLANGYVQLLQETEDGSDNCLRCLDGGDDDGALNAYRRLRTLELQLKSLQNTADGAAPHLIDHITNKTESVREIIEQSFTGAFRKVLAKMNWPSEAHVPDALHGEFGTAVAKLLDLQLPELSQAEATPYVGQVRRSPSVLLPIQVMVHDLELGFRYHFEGDKPTNRLDRPEYFLAHVTDRLLTKYNDFFGEYVQPVLLQQLHDTNLATNPAYIDATSAFITALLPMIRSKVFSMLSQVTQQPQLLSHLIHELIIFDAKLRDDWQYEGGSTDEEWRGMTWDILSSDDWFSRWLSVEKDFALVRYEEIIGGKESFSIDYDSVSSSQTKPTKAAIRLNDLIENTTDHYRQLVSFSQKIRFLIDIQTALLDRFHGLLAENLQAYLSRTSMLTSTVLRTSKDEQTRLQGLPGLETLCKTYGSAEYLEKSMRDWSDDVFFLDLWADLQARATLAQQGEPLLGGRMTLSQVAEKTSKGIVRDDIDETTGSIFDEPAASYKRLRSQCEHTIIELLQSNVRQSLNGYSRMNPWASLSPSANLVTDGESTLTAEVSAARLPPSAELDPLLSALSPLLAFLNKALSQAALYRIVRQVCATIDNYLLDRVLLVHAFSTAGIAQFSADLNAITSLLCRFVGENLAINGLGKTTEAVKLLSVPVKASAGDQLEVQEDSSSSIAPSQWSLWNVERKLIKSSNEEADRFLERFGIERLSLTEARKVLARRVELGS